VVPVQPLPPHCSQGPAQLPSIAVVAGVAEVVTGAEVEAAVVETTSVVLCASTAELGSQIENHTVCRTHVKPLAQHVLPVQSCPPHWPHSSAQAPLLADDVVATVAAGVVLVVAEEAGVVVAELTDDSDDVVATGASEVATPWPEGSTAMSAQFQNSSPKAPVPLGPQQLFSQVTQDAMPPYTHSEALQPSSAIFLK